MVADFVQRLLADLAKRRQQYVDNLIKAAAADHDRLTGTIRAFDDAIAATKRLANDFLIEEEAA